VSDDRTVSWRELIERHRLEIGDGPILADTFMPGEVDVRFDNSFGANEGIPFTAWSEKRVYFPTDYDGSENVRSAPRDPCDQKTNHVGGGG